MLCLGLCRNYGSANTDVAGYHMNQLNMRSSNPVKIKFTLPGRNTLVAGNKAPATELQQARIFMVNQLLERKPINLVLCRYQPEKMKAELHDTPI